MESHITVDRKLAAHRDRYEPPAHPANTLLFAYEDRRFNKMARELRDSDDILKLKILIELNQDLINGNKLVLSEMTSDLSEVLVAHFDDKNDEIREMSVRALAQMCKIMVTRRLSLKRYYPSDFKKMINDPVVQIRKNAYNAMMAMTRMSEDTKVLLDIGMMETFVNKLDQEKNEDILLQVHELIRQLLLIENGTKTFLLIEEKAIELLCGFMASKNWRLREATLKNLYSVSFDYQGKETVLRHDCDLRILPLIRDNELPVRTAAVLCLASLAQLNESKHKVPRC
jgi:hypothetical protein